MNVRFLMFVLGFTGVSHVGGIFGQAPDNDALKRELLKLQQIDPLQVALVKETAGKLDVQVSNTVFRLVHQRLQWTDIQRATEDVIRWEEWPKDVTLQRAEKMFSTKDPLCIYYRKIQTVKVGSLYCFANSFFVGSNSYRVIPQVYTITAADAGTTISSTLPHVVTDLTGIETPPVFLGFIDYNRDVPSLLFLSGPHGSGRFLR